MASEKGFRIRAFFSEIAQGASAKLPVQAAGNTLIFGCCVQRCNPRGQIVITHMCKPSRFHMRFQYLLIGMPANRFSQIAVTLSIARNFFTEPREYFERIYIVELSHRRPDFGKFKYQQFAAWFEYATHFRERALWARHIAQAKRNGDHIKIMIGKWKPLSIALRDWHHPALIKQPVATHTQHRRVDIGQPDFSAFARLFCECFCQIAAAACDIEHLEARAPSWAMANAFQRRCSPADIRSFIRSYLDATESNTRPTRRLFSSSSTV